MPVLRGLNGETLSQEKFAEKLRAGSFSLGSESDKREAQNDRRYTQEVKMAGDKVAGAVIESRGSCDICKRFMTNQQELMELDGRTIHRACMPRLPGMKKRPNTYD